MKRRKFMKYLGLGGAAATAGTALSLAAQASETAAEEGSIYVLETAVYDRNRLTGEITHTRWIRQGDFDTEQEALDVAEAMRETGTHHPKCVGPQRDVICFRIPVRVTKVKVIEA